MAITTRGGLFSLDLLVALLALFLMLALFHASLAHSTGLEAEESRRLALARKAVSYADRLVKVSSQALSPGLAFHHPGLRRTMIRHLVWVEGLEPEVPEVKQVYLDFFEGEMRVNLFLDLNASQECLVVERLVLLEGEKAVLGVKACG